MKSITKEIVKIPCKNLDFLINFKNQYKLDHGVEFKETSDSIIRLGTILQYFAKNDLFFKSTILNIELSKPSWNKGLLIIGDYGTGKSSILQTLLKLFPGLYKYHTALEVNSHYESVTTPNDKMEFYNKYSLGTRVFDDILTEQPASNYGRKEIFKDILEMRCANKAKTILACNFDPEMGRDVQAGLLQFRKKYGGRVYDRLFEMFNIIEFRGRSMRI